MADRIPISAAARIGETHDYDQVVILARRMGDPGLEWVTTWGRNREHCDAAAKIGAALRDDVTPTLTRQAARIAELEAQIAALTEGRAP